MDAATIDLVFLTVVVAIAFTVESTLGFGASLITLALSSLRLPISETLPAFLPVNVVLSGVLVARTWRHVDRRIFLREVLPLMGLGMPIGMVGARLLSERWLKVALGVFLVVVAGAEVWQSRRAARAPLGKVGSAAMLVSGGAIHGAFATGGPMVVYVLGRRIGDNKAAFRATLCLLWLLLNSVLLAAFAVDGRFDAASLRRSAPLVLSMLVGLVVGERLHARVPAQKFQLVVFVMLFVAGVVIFARNLS